MPNRSGWHVTFRKGGSMSIDVVGILVLVLIFVVGTWRSINLGALSLVAAIVLGTCFAGVSLKDVYSGFPADLFVLLVGVTFLFGVATANGTVEWIVDRAAHLVGDHARMLPWVLFVVAAVPTTAGALGPAGIAILAPLGLRLGQRYNINPVLTALMIVHGSAVGNFSPINVLGAIVNQTMEREGLPSNPLLLFVGNLVFNVFLAMAIYWIYGRTLRRRNARPADDEASESETGSVSTNNEDRDIDPVRGAATSAGHQGTLTVAPATSPPRLARPQIITIGAVLLVVVGAIGFGLDIGALALVAAVVLRLVTPQSSDGAEKSIAWNVVLLICGIITYVALLQHLGTIERIGNAVAEMRMPLLAAFAICLIAGAVSAFASSTGTLGALIPLSVPLLAQGEVSVVGFIVALSISATAVDATPFSTVGALTVANAPASQQQRIYSGILRWGLSMILVAPLAAWLIFVLIPSA
jgi:di/tricarboxylate transporter